MSKQRLLVIVTEGPTDEEFYRKVLSEIKQNNDGVKFSFDSIKFICAYGICNFARKIPSKFKREFANDEFLDYEKVVCLCYDLDVFNYAQKPPIDRAKLEDELLNAGANKVIHIRADRTIEDFFLKDIEGIKNYLGLSKKYKLPKKSGLELLKQMFKDSKKTYFKGERVRGFVDALNISLILSKICGQISALCYELSYECPGNKCKRNVENG